MDSQFEKLIVENVLAELIKKGLLPSASESQPGKIQGEGAASDNADYISLPDGSEILVPNPFNLEAIEVMKTNTPARIGVWRAGTRYKTDTLLKFRADHAVAQDAVFLDVDQAFLDRIGLISVQTLCRTKEEHLTRPDQGRRLSHEALETIKQKCQPKGQVQILVVDGLSSSAIQANITDMLPVLSEGLKAAGVKMGTTLFIKNGRVPVQDHLGEILDFEVFVSLIGERPGLGTAESLSAYITYRPNSKTVEADRTVVSNVHKGGTPPAEAAAHLVTLIQSILKLKCTGVRFSELSQG